MSPILGIYASQVTGHLSNYYSIATTTVGSGGASSITFTSIPSTYTHLQIRYFAQTNRATYLVDDGFITFNGDTTSGNYFSHNLYGNGSSANSSNASGGAGGGQGIFWPFAFASTVGGSNTAYWSGGVIDVLDYANTNKNKTIRALTGFDTNGQNTGGYYGPVMLNSGLWISTAATTSITIKSNGSFNQYSSFALYGVK